jgi:hypothetical protein
MEMYLPKVTSNIQETDIHFSECNGVSDKETKC